MSPADVLSVPLVLAALACAMPGCASPSPDAAGSAFAGSETCATCHAQEARFSRYGAHRSLECERCHGQGGEHARAEGRPRAGMVLGDVALCLSCHRRGADAASGTVAAIESFESHLRNLERDHRIKLERRKSGGDCVYCHDPHLLE